jgi:hypothetical protein
MEVFCMSDNRPRTALWAGELPESVDEFVLKLMFKDEPGLITVNRADISNPNITYERAFYLLFFSTTDLAERYSCSHIIDTAFASSFALSSSLFPDDRIF